MNTSNLIKFLDSEEGKKSMEQFCLNIVKTEEVLNNQLERFHKNNNFKEFIEKVIIKYDSDNYKDRWYYKGIQPPEDLYWFLYEYAVKYGRECKKKEWKKYSNNFTSELYYINGYYFNRMDGQGSIIQVIKK